MSFEAQFSINIFNVFFCKDLDIVSFILISASKNSINFNPRKSGDIEFNIVCQSLSSREEMAMVDLPEYEIIADRPEVEAADTPEVDPYANKTDVFAGEDQSGGSGNNDGISMQETGVGMTAFGVGFTAKSNLYLALEGGKNAPKYFKFASKLGTRLSYLGLVMTAYDGISDGWQNSHRADMVIQTILIITTAVNPVVGGVATGIYFIGDLGFQYFHDGQSVTQYYLDN